MSAVKNGHSDVVEMFLQRGASVNKQGDVSTVSIILSTKVARFMMY